MQDLKLAMQNKITVDILKNIIEIQNQQMNSLDEDRDAIARKARGWRGRDESQGFDVSADRNAGKNKREIKVTREDLKRDTKMVREHFSKKAQKNESEKEI